MATANSTDLKQCRKCLTSFQKTEFYPSRTGRDGFRTICKSCFYNDCRDRIARKPKKRRELVPDGVVTPDTKILDANGYDWSWAFAWFKDIPGYPDYAVSHTGEVWSRKKMGRGIGHTKEWRIRRTFLLGDKVKHYAVGLTKDGVRKKEYVHRLVLLAFRGECPEGLEGCHNDGNVANNCLWNVRWDTHLSNMQDVIAHGRSLKGSRHHNTKLTEDQVCRIKAIIMEGKRTKEIMATFSVTKSIVSQIRNGQTWTHVQPAKFGDDQAPQDAVPSSDEVLGVIG